MLSEGEGERTGAGNVPVLLAQKWTNSTPENKNESGRKGNSGSHWGNKHMGTVYGRIC